MNQNKPTHRINDSLFEDLLNNRLQSISLDKLGTKTSACYFLLVIGTCTHSSTRAEQSRMIITLEALGPGKAPRTERECFISEQAGAWGKKLTQRTEPWGPARQGSSRQPRNYCLKGIRKVWMRAAAANCAALRTASGRT